jgi:hypothetical protein
MAISPWTCICLKRAIVSKPAVIQTSQPSRNKFEKGVDSYRSIRYLNKAVEASSAKAPLEATSEPRQLYIVLRDRIAFKIRECNSKRVGILNNRDDESD